MDNIVYTSAAALMIGIFYSAIRHMRVLYISNTQLIIRQSDQIQFILTRVIELDKKIKRLDQELNDLNNSSILDTIQEEEEEELVDEKNENDLNEEVEVELEVEVEDKVEDKEKEISFEIVESGTIKTQKEKGWIRYLF
jgi:hypothetical protein